jgi:hypothetical protein
MPDKGENARSAPPSRQDGAAEFDRAADELEPAVRHLRTTARHFRAGEVPRACAHSLAAYGHVRTALDRFDRWAVLHASIADPE